MVVRMFWGKLRMGKWEEYERYYNETVVPTTPRMERFRGRQLLRRLENPDEGISLTFWENSQDLEKYARSPKRQKVARASESLYTGEYWVKHYEVRSLSLLSLGIV